LNLRGPRSTVCCCVTATTLTGIESNCVAVRTLQNIEGDKTYAKALEEILCLGVDIKLSTLGVLGEVEGRNLGHVLILSLSLFFLELEGDTTDGTTLNTLHQMCSVTCNLF
jgi:hypothetical protein